MMTTDIFTLLRAPSDPATSLTVGAAFFFGWFSKILFYTKLGKRRIKLKDFPNCGQRVEYFRSLVLESIFLEGKGDDFDNFDEFKLTCKWILLNVTSLNKSKNSTCI